MQQGPTSIYCDNVSAIKFSRNPVLLKRSKHIDVRYHFLRELCKDDKFKFHKYILNSSHVSLFSTCHAYISTVDRFLNSFETYIASL
ncbi:unnamed protein product [Prunus brigantina]